MVDYTLDLLFQKYIKEKRINKLYNLFVWNIMHRLDLTLKNRLRGNVEGRSVGTCLDSMYICYVTAMYN